MDMFSEIIGNEYPEEIPEQAETVEVEYAPGYVFVNVYHLDRHKGGNEEGGWYFDTGEIVRSVQVPASLADGYVRLLESEYPRGRGKTSRYSVIYSGGDYSVRIEDMPGEDFSDYRPYE